MGVRFLTAVLSVSSVLAIAGEAGLAGEGRTDGPWLTDYAAAKAVAAKNKQPLLVVFR